MLELFLRIECDSPHKELNRKDPDAPISVWCTEQTFLKWRQVGQNPSKAFTERDLRPVQDVPWPHHLENLLPGQVPARSRNVHQCGERCWCLVTIDVAEDSAGFSFGLFEVLLCIGVDSVSIPY